MPVTITPAAKQDNAILGPAISRTLSEAMKLSTATAPPALVSINWLTALSLQSLVNAFNCAQRALIKLNRYCRTGFGSCEKGIVDGESYEQKHFHHKPDLSRFPPHPATTPNVQINT